MNGVAWFLPGVVSSLVVGVIAASSIARAFGTSRVLAWLLAVSLGVILSATVTPIDVALEGSGVGGRSCDVSRIGVLPLDQFLSLRDASLNVALFVPLGWATALIPNSSRKLLLILVVLALPVGIEIVQLWVPILGRGCESADVIDNLTGLALGFAGATAVRALQAVRTAHRAGHDPVDGSLSQR